MAFSKMTTHYKKLKMSEEEHLRIDSFNGKNPAFGVRAVNFYDFLA